MRPIHFSENAFLSVRKKCILADYKCIFPYSIIIRFVRSVFVCLFFLNRSIIHRFSQSTPLDNSRVKLLFVQLSKHCSKTTESCPNCLSCFVSLHGLQTSKFLIGSSQLHWQSWGRSYTVKTGRIEIKVALIFIFFVWSVLLKWPSKKLSVLRKLCCLQTHSKVTENDIIGIAFSLIMLTI